MDKEINVNSLKKYICDQFVDDGTGTLEERSNKIIIKGSALCSALAVIPFPISSFYILTTTQFLMANKIAELYGRKISIANLDQLITRCGISFTLGVLGQQTVLLAYRTFIPFMGPITSVPLVFSVTYVIGKVVKKIIELELDGKDIDQEELKVFVEAMKKEAKTSFHAAEAMVARSAIRKIIRKKFKLPF